MRPRLILTLVLVLGASAAMARDTSMRAMMADDVNPAALAFWAAGNDPPEGETPAQAAARWAAAIKGAQVMQQKGKVMMAAPYTRTGRWNADAQLMIDIAREGEAAFRSKDAEKAFEIGGRLYDSCNGCHKAYVPRRE